MATKVLVRHIETIVAWWLRLVEKGHFGFGWCPAGFSAIARYAGTNYIFPAMLPTTPSRCNMV